MTNLQNMQDQSNAPQRKFNPLELFRKNRADLSNFLIHLTRNGVFEDWHEMNLYKNHFLYKDSETLDAEGSIKSILNLSPPEIIARTPFGIFKNIGINVGKQTKMDIPPDSLKCVCFSETPLRELPSFYKATQNPKNKAIKTNQYQKFGLAFDTDFVRSKGGHPVFYYDRRNAELKGAIEALGHPKFYQFTKPILPFCEPYGPRVHLQKNVDNSEKEIDFRWEREWRVNGNFKFNLESVAFGMCPEEKIKEFQNLVCNTFPFIDPDWGIDRIKNHLKGGWDRLAMKI